MRLEKIVVHGFKSFGEKTELKVFPGITAIVGPNGCGKCLSGDTLVALADGRLVAIRDLVERALAQAPGVRDLDDGVAVFDPFSGVEVVSLNPCTLRLEARPVEAFIRRSAPPYLLRVRTHAGREVVTTHYHPFFSLQHGSLRVLTAETLTPGVPIALPRAIPAKSRHQTSLPEAVLSAFTLDERVYVPPSPALRQWLDIARRCAGGWHRLAERAGVPPVYLKGAQDGQAVRVGVIARVAKLVSPLLLPIETLKSSGRRGTIRVPREVDGRLARFLGYLVAEGRITPANQVWFVNSDPPITDEFCRLATELFGVRPRQLFYKTGVTDTLIFSRALCLLLDRVFGLRVGGGSAEKAVPPQILTAPDEVVREFLSGLFEGDAYVRVPRGTAKRGICLIEYTTASRKLAEQVTTLLLRLGVFALMRAKVKWATNTPLKRRRTYYSVLVYGADQLRSLAGQLRFAGGKQAILDELTRLELTSNPNLDLVPGATELVRAAVGEAGVPVKPLRPLSPRLAAYVEGRCEASRPGLREVADLIVRHGAHPARAMSLVRRLRSLADSDVYWDTVKEVERIPPPEPWVYDLTVADTHNFVAANIIVHNSNLADAVRWALGEQSPKSLRGHKMEDVIFHGSASHKPLGLADVELVFANDGSVAVPWSEVGVGRRLYRTGESEYLLNRNVCRLRDILDLFIGTGVNPKAYALMDQERLNHVLTAKPLERRVFIEEAAGITRYKQQRAETLGKLDATRQNLLRVRDIMDEVKRQLGSIERQAKKAQQYKTLHAEQQGLARALVAADYAALARREAEYRERMEAHRREEEVTRVRVAGLAAQEATQRALIQETEHRLADVHQSVQKIQGEVERLLERREQMGLQIRELGEEDLRLQEEMRLVEGRMTALSADRNARAHQLEELLAAQGGRQAELEALERQLAALRSTLLGDRERLEALRLDSVRAAGERAELTRAIGEFREREVQVQRRRERLVQEGAAARSEADRLGEVRGRLEVARRQVLEELSHLEARRLVLERGLSEHRSLRDRSQAEVSDLRLAQAACQSRLEALERLEREREGYGSGVRAIFARAEGAAIPGVLGTVADLLEVPSGLEVAVEAVLGDRLQWVVVQRFADAKAGVAYLETNGAGPATFLPLETLPSENGLPHDEGEIRWAARLVGSRHPTLLHYLLGRVALVPQLEQAEAMWRSNGTTETYVTRSGEVLAPTGRLTGGGGRREEAEHSLLGRKRAIRELADAAARLARELAAAQGRLETVEAEIQTLRAEQSQLQQSMQTEAGRRLEGDKDLEQVLRDMERLSGHLATLGVEERQLVEEAAEAARERQGLEDELRAEMEGERRLESTMAGLRAAVETSQEREAFLAGGLTACRVDWAALGERVEAMRRELAHMDEVGADLGGRRSQAEERRAQLATRRADLSREREQTDERARQVAVDRDRLEGEERGIAREHAEFASRLQEFEAAAGQSQRALDQIKEQLHGLELKATEGRVRREELEQEAFRRFGVEAAALPEHHDPTRDFDAARSRLAELEAKLAAMGPVNLVADEEYRELEERLGFLRTQHDDLLVSIKDLEKAIRGMTRTAQERFIQAFEAINRHFGEIFARLFEGGRAELRLVEPEEGEDSLEAGVELMAQPRGKRLQSVTLLSGGEKALTGLALLFAIFYFRPSPFCVLDEVDAPLDDANIHRFLRVLRELCQQTQFIVITHNRKTMEAADILYGITMEEPGLSRLVSVRVAD